jgi:hypothetical protein
MRVFQIKSLSVSGTERLNLYGALVGIRTPNLLIRSEMLYPIELQMRFLMDCKNRISFQIRPKYFKITSLFL